MHLRWIIVTFRSSSTYTLLLMNSYTSTHFSLISPLLIFNADSLIVAPYHPSRKKRTSPSPPSPTHPKHTKERKHPGSPPCRSRRCISSSHIEKHPGQFRRSYIFLCLGSKTLNLKLGRMRRSCRMSWCCRRRWRRTWGRNLETFFSCFGVGFEDFEERNS